MPPDDGPSSAGETDDTDVEGSVDADPAEVDLEQPATDDEAEADAVEGAEEEIATDVDLEVVLHGAGVPGDAEEADEVDDTDEVDDLPKDADEDVVGADEHAEGGADVPGEGGADDDVVGPAADEEEPTGPVESRALPRLLVAGASLGAAAVAVLCLQVVVRTDEDAGGSVSRSAVALDAAPPVEASERLGPLDPFADVRFVRIVHSEAVPMTAEPGVGASIRDLPPGTLLASDDRRTEASGLPWLHVHDAGSGQWGWIIAGRAAGA